MSRIVRYVLLAEAFAVATFGLGWWTVPIIAALWGFFSHDPQRTRNVGLAAAGGWATLLVLDVVRGSVGTMAEQLGGVMNLPPVALYVATLLFPALLAWMAAVIVRRLDAATPEAAPPAA
jgi:hypothetical protein